MANQSFESEVAVFLKSQARHSNGGTIIIQNTQPNDRKESFCDTG